MNKIFLAFAILFGLVVTSAAAQAEAVKHGAIDICQAIDGGTTQQQGEYEVCCATETMEYDDGMVIYGQQYCVACHQGGDSCWLSEVGRNTQAQTIRNLKKALAVTPKQGTVTGN
jgi:hypothetical protein